MALPKFYKVVQDQQGNIVPQVLGSVFNHGTAVLASLYQDDAGTVPLANPMTSDAQYGSFKFYVNPGHYDLSFTKPGYTFEPINDMQVPQDVLTLGTMATQDASAVAITGGSALGLSNVTVTQCQTGILGIGETPQAGYGLISAGGLNLFRQVLGVSIPSVNPTYPLQVGNIGVNSATFTGNVAISIATPAYLLHVNGFIGLPGGTGGIQNSTSRAALKQHIRPLTDALGLLGRLTPRQWEWRPEYPDLEAQMPGTQLGFVTEEITAALPHTAHVDQQGELAHSERGLTALLTAAVQTLAQQVETLTARLAALEQA